MAGFELERWLQRAQVQGIKLGLDNIRAALQVLGHPQRRFPSLLVGGTNGKGSVVAMTAAILQAHGLRVGATISPHLTSYRERFVLDGEIISEDELSALAADVARRFGAEPRCAEITLFELGVALAMSWFARESVDAAVVEVGMGGEFDATRAAEPIVAAIVTVDLDHTRHLGETVGAIARTKARVAEPGMTLVIGERREEALVPIREEAALVGARLVQIDRDFALEGRAPMWSWRGTDRGAPRVIEGLMIGLPGPHQRDNAAVAVALSLAFVERAGLGALADGAVRAGLASAFIAGRLESAATASGVPVLLDGAHNPHSARALSAALAERARPRVRWWLLAAMEDKELAPILESVLPHVDRVLCCRGASTDRFAAPSALALAVEAAGGVAEVVGTPAAGLDRAALDLGPEDELLVAGSLYLIGDVRPLLGLPLR